MLLDGRDLGMLQGYHGKNFLLKLFSVDSKPDKFQSILFVENNL